MMQSDVIATYAFENLEEVRNYLTKHISQLDLSLCVPPFTSTFYQPLRQKIFKNYFVTFKYFFIILQPLQDPTKRYNQELYKFIQVVDEEMLNMFQMMLSQPYYDMIMAKHYQIPKNINMEKVEADSQLSKTSYLTNFLQVTSLQQLAVNIAEWNIQIERTVDNLSRCQLYGLWSTQHKDTKMNLELKSLLAPSQEFNYGDFTKQILLNMLSQGADKFGKFLYSNGLSESNLSFGAVLVIYHALAGTAALPWKVIIPQINVTWLLGGVLGSLALGKVSNYIDRYNELEQIYGCSQVFKEITFNLIEFNEKLIVQINECILATSEDESIAKKQQLSKTLEEFLSNPESIKENDTEILTADDIIKHESEEWVILKKSNNGSVIIKEQQE